MVGRTNASTGTGGGTAFEAYIQITTDANASITAVNLAGDTFSGTADNTGALVLTVTEPGTYTVTETDGGVETVIVADNGETYQITVIAFDGYIITSAQVVVGSGMSALAYSYGGYTGTIPQVDTTTVSGTSTIRAQVSGTAASGLYVTTGYFDLSNYTKVRVQYQRRGQVKIVAVDQTDQLVEIQSLTSESLTTAVYNLSGLDNTKKYRFGVLLLNGQFYVANFNLE